MSYRKEPFVENEYYHIYSRGNSKQIIFVDDYDRDRFLKLLYLCNSETGIDFREDIIRKGIDTWDFNRGNPLVFIGAWVLMPNHFHLYLTLRKQSFRNSSKENKINPITYYLHKLLTSYAKYFNARHGRTGGLFESEFKSTHVNTDQRAKYNFSYIHLNPIKLIDKNWRENGIKDSEKSKKFLKNYKWSSYLDYKDITRPESKILNKEEFPEYFQNIKNFDEEINSWLDFNNPD